MIPLAVVVGNKSAMGVPIGMMTGLPRCNPVKCGVAELGLQSLWQAQRFESMAVNKHNCGMTM